MITYTKFWCLILNVNAHSALLQNFITICKIYLQPFPIREAEKCDIAISNFTVLNSQTPHQVFHKDLDYYSLMTFDFFLHI